MKLDDVIKIMKCDSKPELVGSTAQIIDLQIPQYEKYRAYSIWAKITSGNHSGKICGFHENEVELTKLNVESNMKLDDAIKITNCNSKPELVGCTAQIIDLQIQEFEKYRAYSIWAKMTSGNHNGKIFGFHENEIEPFLAAAPGMASQPFIKPFEKAGKIKVIDQIEEVLRGTLSLEEIAEIEQRINEAKGRVSGASTKDFWDDKTPCWEMFRCPEAIKNECPTFKNRSYACWQIEGTYCKLYDHGEKGDNMDVCRVCRVYNKYGQAQPIEISLWGKGFNTARPVAKEVGAKQ